MLKRVMVVVAVVMLMGVLVYANLAAEKNELIYLKQILPQTNFEKTSDSPPIFKAVQREGNNYFFVVFGEANGYGGPMKMATVIDQLGEIQQVVVVENRETPSFLNKVLKANYLDQFKGREANASLELGADIDSVTGATVSSRAIADAVRQGSYEAAVKQLGLNVPQRTESWQFGLAEALAVLLYLAVLMLGLVWKKPQTRLLISLASVVVLGFWLKIQISLSSVSGLFLGYWPAVPTNIVWYVIVIGGLGMVVFSGRNLYCYWLCPFGGVQELTSMLKSEPQRRRVANPILKLLPKILLWFGLLLIFFFRNPALGSYEPFGTLFGLSGTILNWLLLLVVIVASIFIYRFWCDCLCPVGAFLEICLNIRRRLGKAFRHLAKPASPDQTPVKQ